MNTIDTLLGHTTEELKAMTDEELLLKYKDVFDLEPKPEGIALILSEAKPKKPKAPKEKLSRVDKLKAQLAELNKLEEELSDEDEEES